MSEKKTACFNEFMRRYSSAPWLVGCSGGADSTALLIMAAECPYRPQELTAVYFEHNLRGEEGRQDGDFVRRICAERNIPFRHIELALPHEGNIEAAARNARLEQWRQLVRTEYPGAKILLAHHAGDRRENLLLRLMRGANSSGLTSLRRETVLHQMTILRPLLDFERSELENFLAKCGITDWRYDITNSDNTFDRNYLRNVFFKRFSGLRFQRSLEALAADADYLEKCATEAAAQFRDKKSTPAEFWRNLHPAVRHRALRNYLTQFCGGDFIPDSALSAGVELMLKNGRRSMELGGGMIWHQKDGMLTLFSPHDCKNTPEMAGNWKNNDFRNFFSVEYCENFSGRLDVWSCAFAADELPEELLLAPPAPGETMRIFPSGRSEKVKKLRIDRKMPPNSPLLKTSGGVVVWYPGVRHSAEYMAEEGKAAVIFHWLKKP